MREERERGEFVILPQGAAMNGVNSEIFSRLLTEKYA
jgi:hypothetical protein